MHDRLETTLKQALRFAAGQNEIDSGVDVAIQASLLMCFVTGRWHQYAKSGFKRDPLEHWQENWQLLSKIST